MRTLILNGLLLFTFFSCGQNQSNNSILTYEQNDCDNLQTVFNSYSDAINKIENTNFTFIDNVNTSNSSWIRSASYYSCDEKLGYFIFSTDKRTYIHKDLPIGIWNCFKNASSFGSYYNTNIKNRYQFYLTN
jgi:hypothetical protein